MLLLQHQEGTAIRKLVIKVKNYVENHMDEFKNQPLFYGIGEEHLMPMFQCLGTYIRTFQKDDFIIFCEEPVKCVGIILDGTVQMIKEDLWGNRSTLVTMGNGDLFGESFTCGDCLFAKVSFVAVSSVKVLFLPFDKVMHSCSMACVFHHRLIENMVRLIANKNIKLMEKLDITTKRTLREKISAYLSDQAQQNNSRYFIIPLGRLQLAEYLCVDRSALTRELNIMKEEGLIDFEKNTFRILRCL